MDVSDDSKLESAKKNVICCGGALREKQPSVKGKKKKRR